MSTFMADPLLEAARLKRKFVPADADFADPASVRALYQRLADLPIASADELSAFIDAMAELEAAIDEHGSRLYVEKSCHTDDASRRDAYLNHVRHIDPIVKECGFRMKKRVLESPGLANLTGPNWAILRRNWAAEIALFRQENLPLLAEIEELTSRYDEINGAMVVEFDGKQQTLQQLARVLEEQDRDRREAAWRLAEQRRLDDADRMEEIYDQQLALRSKVAANAGLGSFRDWIWQAYRRFDYTPRHCHDFAEAVEQTLVPLVRKAQHERRQALGLAALRPWDTAVDVHGRPPLRPFDPADIPGFVARAQSIFDRMSPELGADFARLRLGFNLDLDSRPGKQPGGYQCSLEETGQPFIFMNAAGLHRDVDTLLHEAGHAFHFQASHREVTPAFVRMAPIEFCEVASMSMELLAHDFLDAYYPDALQLARAKRTHLEDVIKVLCWIATIDQFQHWIYTNPGHTRAQRTACWLGLRKRFAGDVDYTGLEAQHERMWVRQGHLWHNPFYYIEYGIAQLGSLQLWLAAREDRPAALAAYRKAIALGGSRPLPELFAAAGLRFDFSSKAIEPLAAAVREELAALPA